MNMKLYEPEVFTSSLSKLLRQFLRRFHLLHHFVLQLLMFNILPSRLRNDFIQRYNLLDLPLLVAYFGRLGLLYMVGEVAGSPVDVCVLEGVPS